MKLEWMKVKHNVQKFMQFSKEKQFELFFDEHSWI